jgi:hypothetical protein
MVRQDDVTTRARVRDFISGQPPKVLLATKAGRTGGKQRVITLKVAVPEISLYARLLAEVKKGDEIEANVVTDWTTQGYSTRLAGFSKAVSQESCSVKSLSEPIKTS